MSNAQLTTLKIINADPDLRSFIYQQLSEFDSFVTPNTQILVLSKEPKNKSQHRLSIVINENGTQIQAEATHHDIYQCVLQAKQKLLKQLVAIQDEVISNQDRLMQIEMAGSPNSVH